MTKLQTIVKVGISDMNIVQTPDVIRTSGLGSCVGVVIYDARNGIGGLAHIMLPDSSLAKQKNIHVAKYADTALPTLIERMLANGAGMESLQAKMAGGAQMFMLPGQSDSLRIGPRNVEACLTLLENYKIPLLAQDTGGNFGRTIEISSLSGVLSIRSVQFGIKEL